MNNRNESCFCGSGLKTKKCHANSDIEHGSAFANIMNLYTRVDKKIAEEAGDTRCRKGCFSCCHEHFSISPIEFYFIMYNVYKRDGIEKVRELTEKGYEFWLDFQSKYPDDANNLVMNMTGLDPREENNKKLLYGIADDYKRMSDTPCMFLDNETKACTIYEFRPLVCRTYGVGFTHKIDVPFRMCEYILDGLDYQEEMADLRVFFEEEAGLSTVVVEELETIVMERSYPIFYFLKLQRNRLEVTLRKIDEYKRMSLSKVLANKAKRLAVNGGT